MVTVYVAADATLSQRLQEEIKYEKEATIEEEVPEFLKAFQAEQIWNVSVHCFSVVASFNYGLCRSRRCRVAMRLRFSEPSAMKSEHCCLLGYSFCS